MSVRIGHASISETGTINGKPGDQTGKEVCIRDWYDAGWICLLRPLDAEVAERSATFMEAACANDNIGYGQADRNTAARLAERVGYNVSRMNEPVNTDCSALVDLAACAAGVQLSHYKLGNGEDNGNTTETMRKAFLATNAYISDVHDQYLRSPDYLRRGDILVSAGHTCMVLSNGPKAAPEAATPEKAAAAPMTGKQISDTARSYTDGLPESDWSKTEGAWQRFTELGIVNGLHPQSPITREEFVAVLCRTLEKAGIDL